MDSDDRTLNSVGADDSAGQAQQPVPAPAAGNGTEDAGATGQQDGGTEVSSFRFVSAEEVTVQRVESAMKATANVLARIDYTMVTWCFPPIRRRPFVRLCLFLKRRMTSWRI